MSKNTFLFVTTSIPLSDLMRLGFILERDLFCGVFAYKATMPSGWTCKAIPSNCTLVHYAIYTANNEHVMLLRIHGKDNFAHLETVKETEQVFASMLREATAIAEAYPVPWAQHVEEIQKLKDQLFEERYHHKLEIKRWKRKVEDWESRFSKVDENTQSEKRRADSLLKMLTAERNEFAKSAKEWNEIKQKLQNELKEKEKTETEQRPSIFHGLYRLGGLQN